MKVAIIHDWLLFKGGAENTVEAMCMAYPEADIYTLLYDPENFKHSIISEKNVYTSIIQKFPFAKKIYKNYLPFFAYAIEQFDLRKYDLILSSHHSVAHGVITYPYQTHISYTYTPMRYLWWDYLGYINDPLVKSRIKKIFAKILLHKLRPWDIQASYHPDKYIAISHEIYNRIIKYYRRVPDTIIHCPVNYSKYVPDNKVVKENYFYTISRMVPYKKIDLIVKTFTMSELKNEKLIVAGSGQELGRIKAIAKGHKNITILGHDKNKVELMQKAKAFIFAPHEDFGIVPVEAQAAGTPVIAYGKGGALDTVIEGETGEFFYEQSTISLSKAILSFDVSRYKTENMLSNAKSFSNEEFVKKIKEFINKTLEDNN